MAAHLVNEERVLFLEVMTYMWKEIQKDVAATVAANVQAVLNVKPTKEEEEEQPVAVMENLKKCELCQTQVFVSKFEDHVCEAHADILVTPKIAVYFNVGSLGDTRIETILEDGGREFTCVVCNLQVV